MERNRKQQGALAMDLLLRESLFSYFRLSAIGEKRFAALGVTPGKVSLMRSLKEDGPQSVAQIARARPVARQGVQRMADELEAISLIEFIENPSHRRAKLARLTAKGEKIVAEAMAIELRWAGRLARSFGTAEVETARGVVGKMMKILADELASDLSRPNRK
jgi:DNA-binding MarR family transcriptional regulator